MIIEFVERSCKMELRTLMVSVKVVTTKMKQFYKKTLDNSQQQTIQYICLTFVNLKFIQSALLGLRFQEGVTSSSTLARRTIYARTRRGLVKSHPKTKRFKTNNVSFWTVKGTICEFTENFSSLDTQLINRHCEACVVI